MHELLSDTLVALRGRGIRQIRLRGRSLTGPDKPASTGGVSPKRSSCSACQPPTANHHPTSTQTYAGLFSSPPTYCTPDTAFHNTRLLCPSTSHPLPCLICLPASVCICSPRAPAGDKSAMIPPSCSLRYGGSPLCAGPPF